MRTVAIGFLLCAAITSLGQQQRRGFELVCTSQIATLRPHEKEIALTDKYPQYGKWVTAEGTWKLKTSSARFTRLAVINSVSIDCYDRTMVCTEKIALVHSDKDLPLPETAGLAPVLKLNLLEAVVNEYRIVEWTPTLIRATESLPVADVELQISVTRQTATRLYREKASASESPIANTYVLK